MKYVCLLPLLTVLWVLAGCAREEVPAVVPEEVDNLIGVNEGHCSSLPATTDIYIGYYLRGEGMCDLSLPTYLSVETLSSSPEGGLIIVDDNGNEVQDRYLLPPPRYMPYLTGSTTTVSFYLNTEYSTHFTVKLTHPDQSTYHFKIKLYQPDTNRAYIIKECILSTYKWEGGNDGEQAATWYVNAGGD